MIYAIYTRGRRETLVEFPSLKALFERNRQCEALEDGSFRGVLSAEARQWVRDGKEHETGLWVDGGAVKYARADPSAQFCECGGDVLADGTVCVECGRVKEWAEG